MIKSCKKAKIKLDFSIKYGNLKLQKTVIITIIKNYFFYRTDGKQ